MKLSIIIPVYNVEKYILRCIDSCINQHCLDSDYEIIITLIPQHYYKIFFLST
ncbi:glycosyltransferase [Bacteroides nordii]|uniref:glycosyltransferase n=1 Tax=Bacteroides nordii TaxID=291645 RepID=UPI00189AF207